MIMWGKFSDDYERQAFAHIFCSGGAQPPPPPPPLNFLFTWGPAPPPLKFFEGGLFTPGGPLSLNFNPKNRHFSYDFSVIF